MTDRDEPMWLADSEFDELGHQVNGVGVDFSALECAKNRVEQLARLRDKLTAGRPISEYDVACAHRRAEEAHIRASRAHLAAAEQHRRTAQAHERAARAHDESAARGIGDVEAHRCAAATHRANRDDEYRAADMDLRLAESESTRRGTLSDINSAAAARTGP
jgi:hypothetical protein